MSGIFSLNTGVREVWLLLAGLVGAVFFFTLYPSQHPASTLDISTDRKNVELRAVEHLSRLGYFLDDYRTKVRIKTPAPTPGESSGETTSHLLDSLQADLGRPGAIEVLREENGGVLKAWFWEVTFENPFGEERVGGPGESDQNLVVRYDMEGNFSELLNRTRRMPDERINRELLDAVLLGSSDTLEAAPYRTMSDSLIPRYLYFDLEQRESRSREERAQQLLSNFEQGLPFRMNRSEAEAIARYYIERSGWADADFVQDTVYIERVQNFNTAQVLFVTRAPVHGQQVELEVQVTPVGSLLGMRAFYNSGDESGVQSVVGLLRTLLILLFFIACAVIFFYRIRARAVDTRSALVASILGGFSVALFILLSIFSELDFFGPSGGFYSSVLLLILVGIGGGAACLAFFILFATGDSITRQHWPRKLATYDYIRQGMIFNKPVGTVILRSVALSLVLAGLWSVLLWVFPNLYLHFPPTGPFLHGVSGWPPLYLLLYNAWYSLGLVLIAFLIIGSQIYARTRNRWWVMVGAVLASALLFPLNMQVGPPLYEMLFGGFLGLALYGIFDRWDFSTLLLSLFLLLGWLHSAPGWLVTGSPDLYIFICYLVFLVVLVTGGTLAIIMGKEEKVLPRYVPEYVEELAQEERIKQELQIARQVQQSFLPTRIPDLGKLEMSALCQPAYETGGDYYDFVQLDEHRVGVAIGDVSGKGIQAAFYMTFIKGILHSLCHETDSPAELLKKTNRLFFDNAQKGTFISLVYGIIDTRERTFTFSRAGHNPVLHLNHRKGTLRELQPGGLGIGLTRERSFDDNIREIRLDLEEGDILMLYTDGIVEALNEKRQFYGTARLHDLLMTLKVDSSQRIVTGLFEDVGTFMGETAQHDDMTILLIRFGPGT